MRINNPTLILVMLSIFLLFSACEGEQKPSLKTVFQSINQEVLTNSQAYENLKHSNETIGHRLTGTANGKKAEEHAYQLMRSYGMADVQFHEFEVTAWQRDTVHLSIIMGEEVFEPEVVSLAHSPVSAMVDANMLDVGNGLGHDLDSLQDEIKGKVLLMNIGIHPKQKGLQNLHRSEKVAMAIEKGAIGVVYINTVEGNILLTGTASVTGELIDIPVVCISLEDGLQVREYLKSSPAQASIFMKNKSEKIKARNVIGTIKGSTLPNERIVIGGHLDSWDLATGAIDNGIGSYTILEIARTFNALKLQPKRTVQFVMFMGEEQGLLGSTDWVAHMVETGEIDEVRYLMNLDMAGNTVGFNLAGRYEMETFIDQTGQMIHDIDTSFQNKITNRCGLHSDHQPFLLEGIPILGHNGNLDKGVFKFYHSNGDDFNLVNRDHMNNCARFCGMMLYALADAEEIAAKRLTSEETRQFCIDMGLKEKLELGQDWKWE